MNWIKDVSSNWNAKRKSDAFPVGSRLDECIWAAENRLSRAGKILAIFGLFAVVNGHGIVL